MIDDFNFVITDDGSTGLYNNAVKDIYHSKTGAYTEALQKFVLPLYDCDFIAEKNHLNVLDICYGIGYNTKTLLNEFNNIFFLIDAIDKDKRLVALSPFVNDTINNIDLKFFLMYSSMKNFSNQSEYIKLILKYINQNSIEFFNKDLHDLINLLSSLVHKTSPQEDLEGFLHNIYYRYISDRFEYGIKPANSINFIIGDGRVLISDLSKKYDIVFLDAFSPQKDPTLWTIDFLSAVSSVMNFDSVLVSYSKSTPFRSALRDLGFCVGKTFIDGVDMGTIASRNNQNIKNPLNNYDEALLNTKSGITYKDKRLCLSPEVIKSNRDLEQLNSNRISHTKFIKNYKK